jgi:hypothetical protein
MHGYSANRKLASFRFVVTARSLAALREAVRARYQPPGSAPKRDRVGALQLAVMRFLAANELSKASAIATGLDRTDDSPIYQAVHNLVRSNRVVVVHDPSGTGKYTSAARYALAPLGWHDVVHDAIDQGDDDGAKFLVSRFFLLTGDQLDVTSMLTPSVFPCEDPNDRSRRSNVFDIEHTPG